MKKFLALLFILTFISFLAVPCLAEKIILKNGEIFVGKVLAESETTVTVEFPEIGQMNFARDEILRIETGPVLEQGERARITLHNDETFEGTILETQEDHIKVKFPDLGTMTFQKEEIRSIKVLEQKPIGVAAPKKPKPKKIKPQTPKLETTTASKTPIIEGTPLKAAQQKIAQVDEATDHLMAFGQQMQAERERIKQEMTCPRTKKETHGFVNLILIGISSLFILLIVVFKQIEKKQLSEEEKTAHIPQVKIYHCPKCNAIYQEDQLKALNTGTGAHYICSHCQGPCFAEDKEKKEFIDRYASFFKCIPGAFTYPLRKDGLTTILVGLPFFLAWQFMITFGIPMMTLPALIIGLGFISAYSLKIIEHTMLGKETLPGYPDVTEIFGDILYPYLLVTCNSLIAFAPITFYFVVLFFSFLFEWNIAFILPYWTLCLPLFVILGGIYWPIGMMCIAFCNSFSGLSPLFVLQAFLRIPFQSIALSVIFLLIAFFAKLVFLPVPIAGKILGGFVLFYVFVVKSRLIGLLYLTNKKKLGWEESLSTPSSEQGAES